MMNLVALKLIPWKEIITWAPTLVKMVRNLKWDAAETESESPFDSRNLPAALSQLHERVAQLEAHQMEQAEVFAKMAQQIQALSEGLRVLSARLMLLAFVAGLALITSLGLLLWAILG
jgi:hypothetical protein